MIKTGKFTKFIVSNVFLEKLLFKNCLRLKSLLLKTLTRLVKWSCVALTRITLDGLKLRPVTPHLTDFITTSLIPVGQQQIPKFYGFQIVKVVGL